MNFTDWKSWKLWQYCGMAAFGILLGFLYFTNRNAFENMKDTMKDKFDKKEDSIEEEQKEIEVQKVKQNQLNLEEAERNIFKAQTNFNTKAEETKDDNKTPNQKVDDFNKFME